MDKTKYYDLIIFLSNKFDCNNICL